MPRGRPPLSDIQKMLREEAGSARQARHVEAMNRPNASIKAIGLAESWMEIGYEWTASMRFAVKHIDFDPRDITVTDQGLYFGNWFYPRVS